jgi:hypothetical protein
MDDPRGRPKRLNIIRLQKAYQEFESTSLRQQVSTAEKFCYLAPGYLQKAYYEFEFTSLRHVVSIAERFCYVAREIRVKGRRFATFATQTGPEKMTYERLRSRSRGFSPEPAMVVRFQEPARANGRRSQSEYSAKASLTSALQRCSERTQREGQLDFYRNRCSKHEWSAITLRTGC